MREKFMFTFLFFFIFFMIIFQYCSSSDSPLVPALYVFGDSLVDSGNNNFLLTLAKANFRPYGLNFPRGPTGRFTNGKTVVDFIAEFLNLPFPPPYLGPRLHTLPLTGLNYASSSCGILPETGVNFGKCLNLEDQVELFQTTVDIELLKHFESSEKISEHLSKSIFVISIGSNDYIGNYLRPEIYDTSKFYSAQAFAQLLIDSLSHQLQRLHKLGVRKVVVFEIGPIGCIPSITKRFKHNGQCVEEINQLAVLFNNQLGTMLTTLTNSSLKGSTFVLGHVHWLGYDAVVNPSRYELEDTKNPCCDTLGNGSSICIPGVEPCPNINKHYFWDCCHLTETVYSVIGRHCFNGTSVCIPMNIKELAQV